MKSKDRSKKSKTSEPKQRLTLTEYLQQVMQWHQAGKWVEAEAGYQKILQIQPQQTDALHLLGVVTAQLGKAEQGIELIQKAIRLNGGNASYFFNLASILHQQNNITAAIEAYQQAVVMNPEFAQESAQQLFSIALHLHQSHQFVQAEQLYQQILTIAPNYPDCFNLLGVIAAQREECDQAISLFKQAITLEPAIVDYHVHLGNALQTLGKFQEAIDAYQCALVLEPHDAKLHNDLATTFNMCERWAEAIQHYQQAITLKPDYAEAHFGFSWLLLAQQNWVEGWKEYAWRSSRREHLHIITPISQLPENLTEQRILILSEQGLGDELFFLRFVPFLKARGAWVAYRCGEKISSIVQRLEYIDVVLQKNETLPTTDYTLLLGDLPQALNMTTDVPPSLSFSPLSAHIIKMREQLQQLGKPPYIAITWRAGVKSNIKDKQFMKKVYDKEIPLTELAKVLRSLNATFIAVQRHPFDGEIAELSHLINCPIHNFSALNDNLEEMLALLSLLDDYIGVSNTNTHLIAGLGKTAKILMPYPAEWRWLTTGKESPWFPNFPIYRQMVDKTWTLAVQQLIHDLSDSSNR